MTFLAAVLLLVVSADTMTLNNDAADRTVSRVEVDVDPRVELLSIVFRIAGAEEYQRGRVPAYSADVDAHFGSLTDHSAVRSVAALRRKYGISHDAVVKLAVHAEDASGWRESVPLTGADTLGNRWRSEVARDFLAELRSFAEASRFNDFFEQHRVLFRATEQRLQAELAAADLAWLDVYFGESSGSVRVVAGMLTGRASYGATVIRDSGPDRYAILGVEDVDGSGVPQFDRSVVETVVHELCHSYINPILKRHAEDFLEAGTALFLSQRQRMEAQAYRSGYTVMNETLTRACTNRYLQAKVSAKEVEDDFTYNRTRGFIWIEDVGRELEVYEADRDLYPTLADYVPELKKFFSSYTQGLARTVEELEARRPRVVTSVPPNGATDVRPDLEAIEVTFDRPMRMDSWSVVGGGPKYPDTGTPSYDADPRVFRLPVRLEPDREYEFWLNRGPHTSFASEDGTPLQPFKLSFRTRSR